MHLTRMKWNEVGGGFDGDAARAGRLGIGERQLHTSRSSTRPLCMHVTGSGDLSLNCRRPSGMGHVWLWCENILMREKRCFDH